MALQPNNHILQGEFLFLQPLHFDLVRKIVLDQLLYSRIECAMSSTQLTQLPFDCR